MAVTGYICKCLCVHLWYQQNVLGAGLQLCVNEDDVFVSKCICI